MKLLADLPRERLLEVLSYDPGTGIFHWRPGTRREGFVAGTIVSEGYISIGIDRRCYKAHRLAWLYFHGIWPSAVVDHIDGDTSNNRIENLRDVTHAQNGLNRHVPREYTIVVDRVPQKTSKTLKEKLLERIKIDPITECWEWKFGRSNGYGEISYEGKNYRTHRVSYEIFHGPIAPGQHVCHRCDNPPCCNPSHLFLGTPADNMADKVAKGRQATGLTKNRKCKLTSNDVAAIRSAARTPHRKLAKNYGVTYGYIGKILRGERWKGDTNERTGA